MTTGGADVSQGFGSQSREVYFLRLYISGTSIRSMQAIATVKRLCEQYLLNRYELEVIDLNRQHKTEAADGFIVAPMLIRYFPLPIRKVVSGLGDGKEVLRRLGIPVA